MHWKIRIQLVSSARFIYELSMLALVFFLFRCMFQVWSQPDEDQFIMSAFSTCLRMTPYSGSTVRTFQSADCWLKCYEYSFRLVTWFVVDSPLATVDPKLLAALKVKEDQPWKTRYCVDHSPVLMAKLKQSQNKTHHA